MLNELITKFEGTWKNMKARCKLRWFTFVMKQCFFPWVHFIQMFVMINISLDLLIGTWI